MDLAGIRDKLLGLAPSQLALDVGPQPAPHIRPEIKIQAMGPFGFFGMGHIFHATHVLHICQAFTFPRGQSPPRH